MDFDALTKEMWAVAPGRVTVVSREGLRFALECGIDVWDFAETYTLQKLIADIGTPAQKQRLKETIIAWRWCTEIMMEQEGAANTERNSDS